jgi:hypothetical protein
MTQNEMIEMARQAGFAEPERIISTNTVRCVPDLAYFAESVTEKEREACAKLVDHILKEGGGTWGDAIRARGQA